MLLDTCAKLCLLCGLLSSPLLVGAQDQTPEASPDPKPIVFGPPTRWPGVSSPAEPRFLAPAPAGPQAKAPTAVAESKGTKYFVFGLEFTTPVARKRFEAFKWPRVSAIDQFLEVFVESADRDRFLAQAQADKDLVQLDDMGGKWVPPPPPGPPHPTRSLGPPAERIVRGGIQGLTGKGVIIAILDTGVDFRNPDFITLDAKGRPTSRLLYLWDTQSQAFDEGKGGSRPPLAYPNGASVGTLYTRAQLTAELRSDTVSIPTSDTDGHGTACAGVAAGNGRNGPERPEVVGVAPEADLIAIRTGGVVFMGLFDPVAEWLEQARGKQPLVLSCSMGCQAGGHDGRRVYERSLSARFPLEGRGRALVISAGNEGRSASHARVELAGRSERKELTWKQVPPDTSLRLYVDVPSPSLLSIGLKPGTVVGTDRIRWAPDHDDKHIVIQNRVSGDGGLILATNGQGIHLDAYLGEGQGRNDGSFTSQVAHQALVGTPGTTENAITVGAYVWSNLFDYEGRVSSLNQTCGLDTLVPIGGLACYSSPGFSRSGSVKPEIIAPADFFTASRAWQADGSRLEHDSLLDSSGNYIAFSGTSAAAPYVSGVVALLFQKHPKLSLGRLRELLAQQATHDAFTGRTPNPQWGHGKLDLAAVVRLLAHAK